MISPKDVLCITGASLSGKTEALAARAAAWATPTSDGSSFLFFCASPVTIPSVRERLQALGLKGEITTPYDYALRILRDARTEALTGRRANVLSGAQEAVFFEDLKTSGMKRRRLREMWAFFLCGWANLDDDDPEWIQTAEERLQLELARDTLALEDAMLATEVVNLAVRVLRELPDVRAAFSSPVVLADDYALMSRASQELVNLLANDKLVVAGNPASLPTAFEPYPWPQGLADFCERYDHVQRVELDEPLRPVERTWLAAEDIGQEMGVIARTVAEALEGGVAPERIAAVGTNRVWRANLVRALRSCGLPVEELKMPRQPPLGRERGEASEADRARVLERLTANPSDSRAWREWLSFGDALGRSAAVSELRQVAVPAGLTLAEALRRLDADELAGMSAESPFATSLLEPYREALGILTSASCHSERARRAEESLDDSRDPSTPALRASAQDDTGNPGATPAQGNPDAVAVASPEDLFGRTFDLVIFGGFVNGFIPSRDMCDPGVVVGAARERTLAADHAALRLALSRATDRVLFTGFESCPLEVAEQLKLHIARVRLKDGERICTIEPSSYLAEVV